MPVLANSLIPRQTWCFPPTPMGANITQRNSLAAMGRGHNTTTQHKSSVVHHVVTKLIAISMTYPTTTTTQRDLAHPLCVCMRMRARVRATRFYRCAVVPFFQLIENKEKKTTTKPTTQQNMAKRRCGLRCGFRLSHCKNMEKGAF